MKNNDRFDTRLIKFLDDGRMYFDYINYDIIISRGGFYYVENTQDIKFFDIENDVVFKVKATGKTYTLSFLMQLCGYK